MRIEQLEYIAAVTEHGSLRRASEHLHLSQPALGEAVRNLERELGVSLLDRHRSGAKISAAGKELLHHMVDVLHAVDRLKRAAGAQAVAHRAVRLGTVSAGTVPLLLPAIEEFRIQRPDVTVDVVAQRQAEVCTALSEGQLDLGLVNLFPGDDVPEDLQPLELVRGRPVVCLRSDHPLAARSAITLDDLRAEPFIAMRNGYLMFRFVHRLFAGDVPDFAYVADGADMGKLMVAQGLGVTVLPDYSVDGDVLETAGLITSRPLAGDVTRVSMHLLRRAGHVSAAAGELSVVLAGHAANHRRRGGSRGTGVVAPVA